MGSKKQTRIKKTKARKKKRGTKLFFLSLMLMIAVGFLMFFFVSLFEYMYPPVTGKRVSVDKAEKKKVQLYFSDSNERFMVPEKRYIPARKDIDDQAEELVKALIKGPNTGLVRTFPEQTELRSVKLKKDGTAYVDFKGNFIKFHPGGSTSEVMTIYSLANTLVLNIPDIKRVKLLVDGKELETIKGHIDTSRPFTSNRELIVKGS
jgi:hypothetical protein